MIQILLIVVGILARHGCLLPFFHFSSRDKLLRRIERTIGLSVANVTSRALLVPLQSTLLTKIMFAPETRSRLVNYDFFFLIQTWART